MAAPAPPAPAFAELREADAPPAIASIYGALRAASGVPLVNLIWRHMATMPGVLEWAWEATRGPLESGAVAAARARVAAALPPPAGLAPAAAIPGLDHAARQAPLAVVESYNRGNLTNLIVLTALRRAAEGTTPAAEAAPLPAAAPPDTAPLPPVPPLPVLAGLDPATRDLVRALGARHAGATAGGVVPSLYLHLAHWPGLLQALPGLIGPVLGELDRGREAAIAAAGQEAEALRPLLGPGAAGPVPGGHGPAVMAAIGRFTTAVIPEMVPVGLALRRVLATAPA